MHPLKLLSLGIIKVFILKLAQLATPTGGKVSTKDVHCPIPYFEVLFFNDQ
jgi:hypothetical protein